jgi:hypothetical protein
MNKYEELKQLVLSLEADATSAYNNKNKAAATRVRHGLQKTKSLAQECREEILAIKK